MMAVAKHNIRKVPLLQCVLPHIKVTVVLINNMFRDPYKWADKHWMYRCYGKYTIDIKMSERGGKMTTHEHV